MRQTGPFAAVALLCLVLYIPGLAAIPPLDRDEARFAQASRQMLESGDFIRIRFQDEARDRKPAGIYWLQAASVALFGTPASSAIWPYRLPSAAGAAAAALLTLGLGRTLFPDIRRAGLFAGTLMASALGLVAEAHIAKTDAALCAVTVAGQGALGLAYVRARAGHPVGWPLAAGFWIAEAAGILLKGPIVPLIALATAASLAIADRDLRPFARLRPVAGLCLAAALVLPWLVAIEHATAGRFLTHAVGRDLLPKLLGGQEAHGAPPGTYLALALITFWPGSLLLVPALVRGWRMRHMPAERFLLAWLVPAWLAFELVPTKLPHYVLPLYPALALLAGRALACEWECGRLTRFLNPLPFPGLDPGITGGEGRVRGVATAPSPRPSPPAGGGEGEKGWIGIADRAVRGLWGIVTLALAAVLIGLPLAFGHGLSPAGIAGAAALPILAASLLLRRRSPLATAALLAGLAAAFALPAAAILPGLDRLWLSRAAAALVARHPPPRGGPLVAIGYSEPSLVFMLGTRTRLAAVPAAVRALAKGGEALVGKAQDMPFRHALATSRLLWHAEGHVAGLDYSTGHTVALTLYAIAPD